MTTIQQVIDKNLIIELSKADSQLLTEIQTDLSKLGYYNLPIDGIYGNGTKTAWTNFKKANKTIYYNLVGASSLKILINNKINLSQIVLNLKLHPDIALKAQQLLNRNSNVIFTSGYRNPSDQARAMAENIIENRSFIENTYANSQASQKLQDWVDNNPNVTDKDNIAAGLLQTMQSMSDDVLMHLSRHLTGRAFDVQPYSCTEDEINDLNPQLFLTSEAGEIRWHVQF